MKFKNWLFYLVVIISFCQCKVYQDPYEYEEDQRPTSRASNNMKPAGEEGECFAKCLIADKLEYRTGEYAVFTGDEALENVDIEYRKIVIQQSRQKWIKKKTDRNCKTVDGKGCYTWCLVEQPEKVERIKVLVDTTQSRNFEIRYIEYEVMLEKGGFTEWKPILCKADLSDSIIRQIQNALREAGYYHGENSKYMNVEIKASLVTFQKDHNLPIGNLDFETLAALGFTIE